jgi:hypothetical protein
MSAREAMQQRREEQRAAGKARRAAHENARAAEESARRQACDRIRDWVAKGPVPVTPGGHAPGTSHPAILTMIADARFSAVFGDTFDQIPQADLQLLAREAPRCFGSAGPLANLRPHEKYAVQQALNPYAHATNVRLLIARRTADDAVHALAQQAGTLPATEQGYARLAAIKAEASTHTAAASREEREAFESAVALAEERVALPAEQAQARAAIESARGYEGLVELHQLASRLEKAGGSSTVQQVRSTIVAQVSARIEELGAAIATVERGRIDVLGSGLAGLERGVQWRREYSTRLQPYAARSRSIAAVEPYFIERRAAVLAGARSELTAQIRAATSRSELDALLARYLMDMDKSTVMGTAVLTAAAEQTQEIEKRAVLGKRLDEERAQTAAARGPGAAAGSGAAGGRAPASAPPEAGVTGTAAGEPTEEEMYDVINARLAAVAQRVSRMAEDCRQGGFKNDPGQAVLCLGVMPADTAGAGRAMRITRFEKLGCARATGKPGYVCDYLVGTTGGMTGAMGPKFQEIIGEGGAGQARFLKTREGWMMLDDKS